MTNNCIAFADSAGVRLHTKLNHTACAASAGHKLLTLLPCLPASVGRCSRRHCAMLSLMAPAFMLLVAGALQLGVLAFLVLYIASASLMYALMYASFLQCRRLGVGYMPR